jgi:hypothetical protein
MRVFIRRTLVVLSSENPLRCLKIRSRRRRAGRSSENCAENSLSRQPPSDNLFAHDREETQAIQHKAIRIVFQRSPIESEQ